MWISKKKWETLEKRIADLEGQVQGQLVYDADVSSTILKAVTDRLATRGSALNPHRNSKIVPRRVFGKDIF